MTEIIPVRLGVANVYLLRNNGAYMLVDGGNMGDEEKLTQIMEREHNLHPRALRLVLLTHGHPDHTGAAQRYSALYNVPIAMHALEYGDPPRAENLRPRTAMGWMISKMTRIMGDKPYAFPCSALLLGDESLAEYGFPDARTLALPGHTKGSIGVLFSDGRLISGDMFMCFGKVAYAHMYEDEAALRASAELLYDMGISEVYPGHGKPFPYEKAGRI